MVGPTTTQAEYVARARQELASGEPDQLRHYLTRPRRDRRFERVVTAAIRNGKPIPNDQIDRMTDRYGDRFPELRETTSPDGRHGRVQRGTGKLFKQFAR